MGAIRVLVLDDNQGIRLGVRLYLEACGFEVRDAADCASALRLLEEHTFDVGVMDYALHDGTALSVLATIARSQPAMKTIVLTAYPSATLAETTARSGAARFLTKQIDLSELRSVIDELANER
jgi:DNA-binding NtrC family response regulator